jgi:acyl carrier protein
MNEFLAEMAEILEVDVVAPEDRLDGFDSWDSLAVLSVVAMADGSFGAKLGAPEVRKAETVLALYNIIQSKRSV